MEWQRDFEHCSFDFIWFICKVCHDKQWMLDDLDDPTEIRKTHRGEAVSKLGIPSKMQAIENS